MDDEVQKGGRGGSFVERWKRLTVTMAWMMDDVLLYQNRLAASLTASSSGSSHQDG